MKLTHLTIETIDNGYVVKSGHGYIGETNDVRMSFPDLLTAWNFIEQYMISPEEYKKAKAEAQERFRSQMDDKQANVAAGAVGGLLGHQLRGY